MRVCQKSAADVILEINRNWRSKDQFPTSTSWNGRANRAHKTSTTIYAVVSLAKKIDQMKVLKLCTSRGVSKKVCLNKIFRSEGSWAVFCPASSRLLWAGWNHRGHGQLEKSQKSELLLFSNCACHCDPTLT